MVSEIYVLCRERTQRVVNEFLSDFLPDRVEVADEYELPQFSEEPEDVYGDVSQVIERLVQNVGLEYRIYWDRASEGDPHQAMLFFNSDGSLIAGFATASDPTRSLAEAAARTGARFGYATSEESPPHSAKMFCVRAARNDGVRLVDGVITTRS